MIDSAAYGRFKKIGIGFGAVYLVLLISSFVFTRMTGQTPVQSLTIVSYSNITSSSRLDRCDATYPCIDNRSQFTRQSSMSSYRAVGSGAWSVDMQWADGTPTVWTSFGSTAQVNQTGPSSAIGYGIGPASISKPYHDYIRFVMVGTVTIVNYSATRQFWWLPSVASIGFPITVNQGGTSGLIYPDAFAGSFALGCTAAHNAGVTMYIASTWTIPAGTYNCDKQFVAGGKLIVAASSTAVMTGSFLCPPLQRCIDTTTNSGAVLKFTTPPPSVYPDWWGAASDGIDSAALNAAVEAVHASAGAFSGHVQLNCRSYTLASTWTIAQAPGIQIGGCGYNTILNWTGNNSTPMILISGVINGTIEKFAVAITAAHPLLEVINLNEPNSGYPNERVTFRKIQIDTDHLAGTLTYGVMIDGPDNNNDFHVFEDMVVGGFTEAGFWIKGQNSYSNIFNNASIGGTGTEKVAIRTSNSSGSAGHAGSFTWHGGYINVSVACFELLGYSDFPIGIYDLNSEAAGRILTDVSGTQTAVTIARARIVPLAFSYDDVINFNGGPLHIEDSYIGGANGVTPTATRIVYTCGNNANVSCGLTLANTHIVSSNQTFYTLLQPGVTSDPQMGQWLHSTFTTWQDPISTGNKGFYGLSPSYNPQTATTSVFTRDSSTPQAVQFQSNWQVSNTVPVSYTSFGACETGQTFTAFVDYSGGSATLVDGGHINAPGSPTFTAGQSFTMICGFGDGTFANSYWHWVK